MNDSQARVFSRDALSEIHSVLRATATWDSFTREVDALVTSPGATLDFPYSVDLSSPLQRSLAEPQNAIILHESLGTLDRASAADGRLWTYLAFVTFRSYMQDRWNPDGARNWRERVKTRWLLHDPASRSQLVRHGIARLWWIADLTVDPAISQPLSAQLQDPYAYTRLAVSNEDRLLAIFDRESGGHTNLVRGVLEHIAESPARQTGPYARVLMRELHLVHGYKDLGLLPAAQTKAVIEAAGELTQ